MSNYVSNQLIITGPEAALQQFEQRAKGVWPWRQWDLPDDYRRALMVTEFIPPPLYAINDYSNKGWNWCINVLGTKHGAFDAQVEQCPGGDVSAIPRADLRVPVRRTGMRI